MNNKKFFISFVFVFAILSYAYADGPVPCRAKDSTHLYCDNSQHCKIKDNIDELCLHQHLLINDVDSTIYIIQEVLSKDRWQRDNELSGCLAFLKEKRVDLKTSLEYFKQLEITMDSLEMQQMEEETLGAETSCNGCQQQGKPGKWYSGLKLRHYILIFWGILLVVFIYSGGLKLERHEREASLARQQLLEHEKEEQQRQSQQKLEENRQKLAMLEQQLAAARQQDDAPASERLLMEAEVLTSQNQNIEARQRRKEALLRELMNTALYQRLKAPAKEGTKKMTEAEWQQLATSLDEIYDQFSRRLLQLAKLSETELRICYLLKIKMSPAEIADILCKSKAAITLARRRMYEKLTATKGKAEQLDELILEL